jgi:hypothetical protein
MMNSADPAIAARGRQLHQQYIQDQSAIAGARAGGTQGITEPPKDFKSFVMQERTAAYGALPKLQTATDFHTSHLADQDYWKNPQKAYEGYVKQSQASRQQLDVDLSKYEKSSAPRMGVSYQEYMQDRSKWDGSAPEPTPPAVAGGTGSQWNPK